MKKRFVSAVLAIMLLLGAICVYPSSATAADAGASVFEAESVADNITVYSEELFAGDVNLDGKINGKDNLALQKLILGNSTVGASRLTCDVSKDGKLNGKDKLSLKKVIAGTNEPRGINNTIVNKVYSADEAAAKLTVSAVGDSAAFFEIPVKGKDIEKIPFLAIVWKGADGAEVSVAENGLSVTSVNSTAVDGDEYGAFVSDLSSAVTANSTVVEVKYSASPVAGDELYIDSLIFAETKAEADTFVAERLALRKPEPEAKYIRVDFNNAASANLITATNHTNYHYDAGYDALKLQVAGASGDPWALVDLSSYNISADEYKYVVYTAMTPSGMHQPTPEGELFFSAGSIAGPTAGYSSIFSVSADSQFHSKIFEMTNASFWTGKVHSVRIDYYCACALGDSAFVDSIIFCNSYEAAQAICVDRETLTTDVKVLFDYGLYHDGSVRIPYRIYVPYNYDSSKDYPVLTLLHGAGERGTNGTHQLTQGFPKLFDDTANVAFSSIVIAPHCPTEYRWVEFYWGDANYSCEAVPESEPLKAVVKVLNNVKNNYSVDEDRFYVSGMSMGGFGTWDLLARHSDMFAAAVPICGGGDPSKANILKEIPIRTFHGTADNIVPLRATTNTYNAIIEAGGTKITYTALGGMDHFIWDHVYQQDWVFDWLFQQNRADR